VRLAVQFVVNMIVKSALSSTTTAFHMMVLAFDLRPPSSSSDASRQLNFGCLLSVGLVDGESGAGLDASLVCQPPFFRSAPHACTVHRERLTQAALRAIHLAPSALNARAWQRAGCRLLLSDLLQVARSHFRHVCSGVCVALQCTSTLPHARAVRYACHRATFSRTVGSGGV
jgi:hypothetical protein